MRSIPLVRSAHAASAAVALTFALASFAPVASAQAASVTEQDIQRSRALFERGRKLTEQSLWEEACLLFAQAHELHATGGTALQLANCYEHIGKIDEAIKTYRFVIEHADTERVEDRVRIARERIEALERRAVATRVPASAPPPPPTAPDTLRLPAYVSLGAGGVGLVVGTLFGVLALSQAGSVKSTCASGVCPLSQQSAADSAKAKGWVSTIGFGVGIVGVSVGAALLVIDARRGHPVFGANARVFAGTDGVSFRF